MKTFFFKKRIIIPVLVGFVLITTSAFKNDFFEIAKQIEIFTTLFKEINMNYVDETNPAELMDTAIKSMLEELDPYTNFMNEQDVEASRINNTGDYTGIGAKIKTLKNKAVIIEPYKNYPADQAGLKIGDEIIKIDDVVVENYDGDVGDLLRGSAGSIVNVTFTRQGKTQTAAIKRAELEIKAVPYFSLIENNIGYIVLNQFNSKAYYETNYALRDLKAQGAKSIILDLRGNPGGLLNEAIKIVNLFVPKDQLIVTTKSKVKKYNKTYITQNDPIDTEIPLVVIIDGKSASASEIVSGALQDLDRAVIIGSRSYGKGLVQRPKELTYGTHVKITISRYYTPSGRCIQALDYRNRNEEGEAVRVKQENYNAYKTKNGRKVFDGGGVLPDEIIGAHKKTPIIDAILNDDLVFKYAVNYYYTHKLENINTFNLTDNDFNDFKNYLKINNFSFKTKTEKELLKAFETASNEDIDTTIKNDFNTLMSNLEESKPSLIDKNKTLLLEALTEEIIKCYSYREGLYEYYKQHDERIKKAKTILNNLNIYNNYLK